jgi:hypothetical protein
MSMLMGFVLTAPKTRDRTFASIFEHNRCITARWPAAVSVRGIDKTI